MEPSAGGSTQSIDLPVPQGLGRAVGQDLVL